MRETDREETSEYLEVVGENRDTLLLIGAALDGIGGIYKFVIEPRLTATIDYTVCRGELESQCQAHGVFIGCNQIREKRIHHR